MVAGMGLEVGFTVYGRPQAVANLMAQNLDPKAYVDFENQLFRELNIQKIDAESKNLGKHDGRTEVASLGQFSPPAGALLTANEVRSV